ncbi:MAG: Fe-S cluster assembly protein SufB [Candidatus Woesearchaeota archaeon]|jgi:Fe-S cluster assembly protein SufB
MRKIKSGINEVVVQYISQQKKEPSWMLDLRLKALQHFKKMTLPTWGPHLSKLHLNKITYFAKVSQEAKRWEDVPKEIKDTFEKLGIPEAERKALAGVGTQYESESVYHNLKEEWAKKGVIFENIDTAIQQYPDIVKQYFMKCVPYTDHIFAALHYAVFSGGTFIYIPKGVKVKIPLQAYFRMNASGMGQFEHTLIILDEDAEMHYIEGCSAPQRRVNSLHAGCVEIFIKKNAHCRYSSVENWSKNTYNLNTKRAIVEEEGAIEWLGGNMGSCCTMLYPCSILKGKKSTAVYTGIAFAGTGQNQDTGAKAILIGEQTSCTIKSKSISKNKGITTYRGNIKIHKGAKHAKVHIICEGLLLDKESVSHTIPKLEVYEETADIGHEATTGKISKEKLFYLMSKGLSEEEAIRVIVTGFVEPFVKQLPLEYAIELNRLIEMEIQK